jgi:hypothetical protein
VICNENGRCWRERDDRRVRDSYGYDAPREQYIERRGYEERDGIGIRVPGVSVGIGTDRKQMQKAAEKSAAFLVFLR